MQPKINVKMIFIIENEKVKLGSQKIDQVDSFTYLGSIFSEDGGCSEEVKGRMAKVQGVISQLIKFGRTWR